MAGDGETPCGLGEANLRSTQVDSGKNLCVISESYLASDDQNPLDESKNILFPAVVDCLFVTKMLDPYWSLIS